MVAVTRAWTPVLATIALWGAIVAGSPAAADPAFEVELSASQAQLGESVTVTGTGWPAGRQVTVSICQDPGGGQVLSCAPDSSTRATVSWDGYVEVDVPVAAPDDGCPCVVAVDAPSTLPVTRPLRITSGDGASLAAPAGVVVEEASLEGGASAATWFGAAASPDLRLRVTNGGEEPADLSVRVQWRDGDGDPVDVPVPPVEALAPGETRTVEVPLRFESWSQGSHVVEGTISTAEMVVPFQAETSVVPWGLYGLAAAALALAAGWRNRWLFVADLPRPGRGSRADRSVEERALEVIDQHAAKAVGPLDPAEVIARATVDVPRQRTAGARSPLVRRR